MQVQGQELAERLRLVSGQTSWYLWRHKATNQNHYIFTVAPPITQSKGSMCNTSVTVSTSLFNYASKMLQLKIHADCITAERSNCRAQLLQSTVTAEYSYCAVRVQLPAH